MTKQEKRNNLICALKAGSFKKGQIGRRHLRNRHEVEEVLKGLLRRDGAGMLINLIHFTDDGRVIPSLHTQDYGFMVRRLEELGQLENCKALKGHDITGRVSRFCRSVLMISVQSLTALAGFFNAGDNDKDDWSCKAIYRTISSYGNDRFWGFAPGPGGGVMYDMCSAAGEEKGGKRLQESFPLKMWEKVFAVNGYYVYDGSWATSSPGELKSKVLMLPGVYHGPFTERKVAWRDFFHEATSGAWSEFCRRGESLTFEAIAEFTARVTLVNAYAKYFATPMTAFAVYTGKIKAVRDSGLIPKGHEFMDGLFLYRDDYIKKVIEDEGEVIIDTSVTGLAFQSRPLNVKGLGLVVDDTAINRFMVNLNAERLDFVIGDMTDEQVRAWWNLSMKKFKHKDGSAFDGGTTCTVNGKQVDLANKLIVFYWGDEKVGETPDCFADANALKVGFDPTGDVDALLKVLAMPHRDNGINRTSGQMLASALAADYDRTVKQLKVILDINLQERKERLTCEQGTALSWADLQGKTVVENDETGEETVEYRAPNYVDLVNKVAPILSTRYSFAAWRKRVDAEVKQVSKMLNRLNLPVEGTHVTIVPDLGMVFGGVSVLGVNEAGVTEIFSNNPLATTITKEEYVKKYKTLAAEAGVSTEVQQDFEATVNGLSEGLAVVPADEITARANEGWDFDGDSMYLFKMNKRYVETTDENGEVHYRWATDEEADGAVIWDCGNRYPKTNVDGFVKLSKDNWFGKPVCVRIK